MHGNASGVLPPIDCWGGVYSRDDCCNVAKYGPEGNVKCWGPVGEVYNFHRCCVIGEALNRQRRYLLLLFAAYVRRGWLGKAGVSLIKARALDAASPDVEFDISLHRALLGLQPRPPGSSPLLRLVESITLWPQAELLSPRLLCIVFTASRAHAVQTQWHTWGRKCDHFVAATDRAWPRHMLHRTPYQVHYLDTEGPGYRGYQGLWQRNRALWLSLTEDTPEDHSPERPGRNSSLWPWSVLKQDWQWVYITGDDTFVVTENLRKELLRQEHLSNSVDEPLYVGQPLRGVLPSGQRVDFQSGGAGYALNRAAATSLRQALLSDPLCGPGWWTGAEDILVASCLLRMGVFAKQTAASAATLRFHPFGLDLFLNAHGQPRAIVPQGWDSQLEAPPQGFECCAADAVSFHDVKPLWAMEMWAALHCRATVRTASARQASSGAAAPGADAAKLCEQAGWLELWPSAT
eukprot:TRINITY_DN60255_c0_g1_i1.p1 TRINITY_DN60255_c0_g1~~TRINITY_DN60255_c0_g1_i1.p1  ORF type:complete len:462 (+),score=48.33 TRINITY_DN60255_c0_g1_i1:131-1516(+)